MSGKPILLPVISGLFLLMSSFAHAHCEIPCGIYDDKMRITMLEEHLATIEKAMGNILELEKGQNSNQMIRWVLSKEDHANKFQEIVSQYFLTQRIKPGQEKYGEHLELLHKMLVFAMKCKQTTDLENAAHLKTLVQQFEKLYFGKHN